MVMQSDYKEDQETKIVGQVVSIEAAEIYMY